MGVVGTHSCKELTLLVAEFPVAELPVVAVHENCDNAAPATVGEIRDAVVHVERDFPAANFAFNLHQRSSRSACNNSFRVGFLRIDAFLQELLHVVETEVSRHEHCGHNNDRVASLREVVGYKRLCLETNLACFW